MDLLLLQFQVGISCDSKHTVYVLFCICFVSETGFAERCTFTEHGRRATMYLHIVRAYFVIQNTAPGVSAEALPSARLTYRTFSPVQIAAASGNTAAKFEDVRSLLERINLWVQSTGSLSFRMSEGMFLKRVELRRGCLSGIGN